MKCSFKGAALAAGVLMALPSAALAQHGGYVPPEDELAEAMVIMDVMFPVSTREQTMIDLGAAMGGQMASAMMTGPIFEEPGIKAIVDEFLADLPETMRPAISKHLPQIIKATAIAYTREFSLQELRDIRTFAETPSGKRYFANVQNLINDPVVAEANQEFFQSTTQLQQAESEAIRQKVEEYLAANPEVLKRLSQSLQNAAN